MCKIELQFMSWTQIISYNNVATKSEEPLV